MSLKVYFLFLDVLPLEAKSAQVGNKANTAAAKAKMAAMTQFQEKANPSLLSVVNPKESLMMLGMEDRTMMPPATKQAAAQRLMRPANLSTALTLKKAKMKARSKATTATRMRIHPIKATAETCPSKEMGFPVVVVPATVMTVVVDPLPNKAMVEP